MSHTTVKIVDTANRKAWVSIQVIFGTTSRDSFASRRVVYLVSLEKLEELRDVLTGILEST